MCEKTRQTFSLMERFVALLDIETATFAYNAELDKAKATAELASTVHDALVKYSQSVCKAEVKSYGQGPQPWIPDDGNVAWNVPSGWSHTS